MSEATSQWEALKSEHLQVRLGRLWLGLVRSVAKGICARYPGREYGAVSPSWGEDDVDDLVSEVVLKRLLEQGQIEYIVAASTSVDAARGLVGMHVKQVLASRRVPTQADRVADRLWVAFQQSGEALAGGQEPMVRPIGSQWTVGPDPYPIEHAVRILSGLPRLPNRGVDRASPVFSSDTLDMGVRLIWEAIPVPVTRTDVRNFCQKTLTALIPTLFELDEGLSEAPQAFDLTPEEEALVRDTVARLLDLLSWEQREIVAGAGVLKDAELAALIGVSRPTVIKRRQEISAILVGALEGLEQSLKDLVVLRLRDALGASA